MNIFRRSPLWILVVLLLSSLPRMAEGAEIQLNGRGLRLTKKLTTLREIRNRYITFQEYDYSCGAAVISTLLTYYFGEPATEKEVIAGIFKRADLKKVLKRRAFSLLDMKRFAQAKGFKAVGYKMDFDFLVELTQPVIVPVNIRSYKHFVVVKGIVGDRVVIADPAYGNYNLRLTRFLPVWTPRVGFVLKRENPKGPMTEEDLSRQARFMAYGDLRLVVTPRTGSFTPIPGQVQSIRGPRAPGGSFVDFLGIQVSPSAGSP
ncbi:MAG: C39 family peptidase [Candidatus Methylomirabilales bacterium]